LKRYEAMFLFDNTASHQWSEMEAEVRRLCNRIQADLQVCVKFDERKLAYEIRGRKRGTYVLTYFDAEPNRIADLERDARLSEFILRTLVLRADSISAERLAELKAWPAEQPLQPTSGEGRRGEPAKARRERPSGAASPAAETGTEERKSKDVGEETEATTEVTAGATPKATTQAQPEATSESDVATAREESPAPETAEDKSASE
jgi:small subunit ribosomal protein S6